MAIILGTASFAMAAPYSGGTVTSPGIVAPGGTIDRTESGFLPNSPIATMIQPGGTTITGIITNGSRNWAASIPAPTNVGTYTITATDGTTTSSTTVTVAVSGGGSGLPITGSSASLPLAQAGAALVAAGALVVFSVRRSASENAREDVSV